VKEALGHALPTILTWKLRERPRAKFRRKWATVEKVLEK
jgi:hypothetical protein